MAHCAPHVFWIHLFYYFFCESRHLTSERTSLPLQCNTGGRYCSFFYLIVSWHEVNSTPPCDPLPFPKKKKRRRQRKSALPKRPWTQEVSKNSSGFLFYDQLYTRTHCTAGEPQTERSCRHSWPEAMVAHCDTSGRTSWEAMPGAVGLNLVSA